VLVPVRDLEPGDHVCWFGLDMVVESVWVDPMSNLVSVSAGGRRSGFDWSVKIELIGDP
jgi:hypothetical protein